MILQIFCCKGKLLIYGNDDRSFEIWAQKLIALLIQLFKTMISEGEHALPSADVNKRPTFPLSTSIEESKARIENNIPNGKINHASDENGRIVQSLSIEHDNHKMDAVAHCTCSVQHSNEIDFDDSSENLLCESVRRTHIEPQFEDDIKEVDGIRYTVYESEKQMPDIMRLITKDLSEPYSIYTYRYFIHNWPKLCFLVSKFSHHSSLI